MLKQLSVLIALTIILLNPFENASAKEPNPYRTILERKLGVLERFPELKLLLMDYADSYDANWESWSLMIYGKVDITFADFDIVLKNFSDPIKNRDFLKEIRRSINLIEQSIDKDQLNRISQHLKDFETAASIGNLTLEQYRNWFYFYGEFMNAKNLHDNYLPFSRQNPGSIYSALEKWLNDELPGSRDFKGTLAMYDVHVYGDITFPYVKMKVVEEGFVTFLEYSFLSFEKLLNRSSDLDKQKTGNLAWPHLISWYTTRQLSIEDIIELTLLNIAPAGLLTETELIDGTVFFPREFLSHDDFTHKLFISNRGDLMVDNGQSVSETLWKNVRNSEILTQIYQTTISLKDPIGGEREYFETIGKFFPWMYGLHDRAAFIIGVNEKNNDGMLSIFSRNQDGDYRKELKIMLQNPHYFGSSKAWEFINLPSGVGPFNIFSDSQVQIILDSADLHVKLMTQKSVQCTAGYCLHCVTK
ncbi:MAG: hypothetical protein QE271_11850 [Bacteriovoracaceae bacterium]|nr:hypothetical protein [Bacteriovoracaceae bacterium]